MIYPEFPVDLSFTLLIYFTLLINLVFSYSGLDILNFSTSSLNPPFTTTTNTLIMALRNYMYAKHSTDTYTSTLINKSPSNELDSSKPRMFRRGSSNQSHLHQHKQKHHIVKHSHSPSPSQSQSHNHLLDDDLEVDQACNSGREIVLDDGTKKCANCSDCPKKSPKISEDSFDTDSSKKISGVAPKVEVLIANDILDQSNNSVDSIQQDFTLLYFDEAHNHQTKEHDLSQEIDFTHVL